ncbi:MAG TPA: DUF2628 domain-containing protein [Bradyrhizobium sp.]|nr:DUF2628 domain-containing protein [Bradyrhizobium sp.]
MPVYTVHAPVDAGVEAQRAADRFVFVRDGFHFWAFLLGPLWLAWRRLWLALIGYILMIAAVEVALSQLRAGGGARVAVMLLIAVLMGLEAASLRRWTLSRRRWRQLDVVVADDEDAAERRFFDRWMSGRGFGHQPMTDRGAPPPTRDLPGQPFARPPSAHGDIVGLFPQPGGSR